MKQTVKKNDYEIYTFNIPLSLHGKKKRAFITKELEKKHPCFSQQNCFDTKLRLKKNGFESIVAVMDKVKLLEYKGKSKNGLALEGVKNLRFFDEKNKTIFVIGLFLIASALGIGWSIIQSDKLSKKNIVKNTEEIVVVEKNVEDEKNHPEEYLEKLFLLTAENGGVITSFSYSKSDFELDDLNVKISLDEKKIFPEKIGLLPSEIPEKSVQTFSPVLYQDDEPTFTMDFAFSVKSLGERKSLTMVEMSQLRDEIKKSGKIIYEDFRNGYFKIVLENNMFSTFFADLGNAEKKLNLDVNKIFLTQGQKFHNLEISFSKKESVEEKTELNLLADFWNLFCPKKVVANQKSVPVKKNVTKKSEPKHDEDNYVLISKKNLGEKIGGVVTKEGKRIAYYRDSEGKIKGVEE